MNLFTDYALGFKVNGTPIPDPTTWSGEVSDLDIFGERDQTGLLHRKRVAKKEPMKLNYTNITWEEAHNILALTSGESFAFTFRSIETNAPKTIIAYRGANVNYTVNQCFGGDFDNSEGTGTNCLVTIDFSIIEY